MSGGVAVIRIEGLRELQKALRELDKKLPAELRKVNLSVAQMVATRAQAAGQSQGRMAARAASTIKARAEQRNASVTIRATAAVPFALGAEFGAGHGVLRQRSTGTYEGYNQFQPWRGNSADAGYFMYPTIRAENEHIVDAYEKRLTELLAITFPD